MKRFVIKFFAFAASTAVALMLVHSRYARHYPVAENYFAAADDKGRILATNPAPRLIIIGGSSAAFGLDSELVGRRCGRTGVNMGVQVAFGLSFMLSQIEPHLRPGDVVIVAAEYSGYAQHFKADAELLGALTERNPAFAARLPRGEIQKLLDRGIVMRVGTVLRAMLGAPARILEQSDPIYYRRAFNGHGDLVSYIGKQGKGAPGTRFKYVPGTAAEAIGRLNAFHQHCAARGAKVFITHPPFSQPLYEQSAKSITTLERELRECLTIPFLDRPEDTALPPEMFFDTGYHLNPDARRIRSEALAERLIQALAPEVKPKQRN